LPEIERVLTQIALFHQAFNRALTSRRERDQWFAEAENAIRGVDSLLTQPEVASQMDALLKNLTTELQKGETSTVADQLVHSSRLPDFLRTESRLHYFADIKKDDYDRVVSLVKPFLASSSIADFPKTSDELRRGFVRRGSQYIAEAKSTVVLPRKEKRQYKDDLHGQVWRYSVGTIMTLANMFWAFSQPTLVTAGIASTSITCGSRLFGMSIPRKPPRPIQQQKKRKAEAAGSDS
jgi:hypothetical protein